MILLITKENLKVLEVCFTGLERALTKTTLGKSWDFPSLIHSISTGHAYAFHQVESGYSGVFTFLETPLTKSLHWWWSGKDPENKIDIDYTEVDNFLVAAAKFFDCTQIIGEGRKGWEKIGGPLGYVEDSRTYTKEV